MRSQWILIPALAVLSFSTLNTFADDTDKAALQEHLIKTISSAVSALEEAAEEPEKVKELTAEEQLIESISKALETYQNDAKIVVLEPEDDSEERLEAQSTAFQLRERIGLKERKRAWRDVSMGNRAWTAAESEQNDVEEAVTQYERAARYYSDAIRKSADAIRRVGAVPKYSR